jgi:tetratricopeptide (TPR) repeat protein
LKLLPVFFLLLLSYNCNALSANQCIEQIEASNSLSIQTSISEQCASQYPKNHKLLYLRALTLYAAKQYEDACKYFYYSLKLNSDNPQGYLFLLQCLIKADVAISKQKSLLKSFSKKYRSKGNLLAYAGDILVSHGQMKTAFDFYAALLLSNAPDAWLFHLKLGQMYCINKNWTIAKEHLEKSLKLNPGSPMTLFHLAKVWNKLHNIKYAISFYEHALKQNPDKELESVITSQLNELKKN